MYGVRCLPDASGAIVESYSYDPYGKPLIRESAGLGDMTGAFDRVNLGLGCLDTMGVN